MHNNRCLYDFPCEQGGWRKKGQLKLDGLTGSIFDPYVLISDTIRLYYSDRQKNTIEMIQSQNGEDWSRPISVMKGSADTKWDNQINRASVVFHNGTYKMWFTGQHQGKSAIGVALSKDGTNFEKLCNNPVLKPEYDYEGDSVMNPCVIWDEHDKLFKMWYSAGETYEPDVICYATSEDGVEWKKMADLNPVLQRSEEKYDCCKVGGCDVHKISNDRYIMFYIGYQNVDVARICVAESTDGITGWKRSKENPILAPSPNEWDSDAIYKPCVGCFNGNAYLWYNGRKKNVERIGYAINEGLSR